MTVICASSLIGDACLERAVLFHTRFRVGNEAQLLSCARCLPVLLAPLLARDLTGRANRGLLLQLGLCCANGQYADHHTQSHNVHLSPQFVSGL
jgi:hypothetical protein